MVQAEALLAPCGLIEGSVDYPMPLRSISEIRKLHARLSALHIDRLYYLTPETSLLRLIRHYVFFKACVDEGLVVHGTGAQLCGRMGAAGRGAPGSRLSRHSVCRHGKRIV